MKYCQVHHGDGEFVRGVVYPYDIEHMILKFFEVHENTFSMIEI